MFNLEKLWGKKNNRTPESVIDFVKQSFPPIIGEHLQSLIVYGVHTKGGESRSGASEPVRFLIVVSKLEQNVFSKLAEAIKSEGIASQIAPIILSVEELHGSTDVFPITFLEMQRRYDVLAGQDVLSELAVSHVHLRLRCEQELKNLLLRIQGNLLLHDQEPGDLFESLRHSRLVFIRVVRAALMLIEIEGLISDDEIINKAAEEFSLDKAVLNRVTEFCQSADSAGANSNRDLYWAFLIEVRRAAAAVDTLPEEITVLSTVED